MVSKGIAHDKKKMTAELDKAKTDKKHPLHFDKADDAGFTGGKKTSAARASYHAEHETAMHTVHALANHPDFKKAIAEKHTAKVMGGTRSEVSDTWKKYGATKGGTSKADVSIRKEGSKSQGLKLSMKKGGGSQLMSGGPEENSATHDYATREMLNDHPKYKKLSKAKKDEIHSNVMKKMSEVGEHLNKMRTTPRSQWETHRKNAQKALDDVHDKHPELNHYVRKEATTGEGKFGLGSAAAASHMVKSGQGNHGAEVKHVKDVDYSGPRPRAALPKGDGRSGNVKLDT